MRRRFAGPYFAALPKLPKYSQMPSNLVTLFAHIMSRATEGSRGSTPHSWDEVLQPAAGSEPGPFPMSAQDWRKAEAFSVQLQALLVARHDRCTTNGNGRRAGQNGSTCNSASITTNSGATRGPTPVDSTVCVGANAPSSSAAGKTSAFPHVNGKVKLKGKPTTPHASSHSTAGATATATPAPEAAVPRHHVPRVTPKELSRAGEPSAPTKVVGRVAAARRVNGSAEGAVASLAVSRAGPGAFETPSHSHLMASPSDPALVNSRGREHSPSRYPARLRSRRFPQLGSSGETPEISMPRAVANGGEVDGDCDPASGRRSPRNSLSSSLPRGQGRSLSSASQQHPHDWLGSAGGIVSAQLDHSDEEGNGQGYGMRTRALPKPACIPGVATTTMPVTSGASTPQASTAMAGATGGEFRAIPPMPSATIGVGARVEAPRPRQVLQGGRSARAPVPRSSVGGRNYTDNHVKQLGLIEAAVVASATAQDHATYNLPRQGRTLTLTNVFKFVALRGAGAMYNLATEKQVEGHTGRHSNFFDGKIDARIVAVIKKDIGDEGITKSRKFSKILLSLVAEGKTSTHRSSTSEAI